MAITPISTILNNGGMNAGIASTSSIGGLRPSTLGSLGSTDDDGEGFAATLGRALDQLQQSHATADALAVQAATGDLNAVHDYTIAATEAQLLTQLTVEVRNRAIEAFNDIMRMQV